METESKTKTGMLSGIIELLETSKSEIEQFRSELGDEKYEIRVKYNALIDECKAAFTEIREMLAQSKEVTKERSALILTKLDALEMQLNASTINVTDDFAVHLVAIGKSITSAVTELGKQITFGERWAVTYDRLHRLKIKFQILKLKMKLGKLEVKIGKTRSKKYCQRQVPGDKQTGGKT